MGGFFASIATFFTQGVAGYATLLVFSLATITGSMYVLSTRQANDVIFANARFENSAISTGSPADFKPETQVRTVIVNFEGGVATGLREAVTNLAGAIRAVSSNIIAEALREDAARAAALAARPSAFGLSADSQLAAQGSGLGLPVIPTVQPTAAAQVATAQPTAPPAATPIPPQPTTAPTQAPPAPTAIPTQPLAPTTVPATPIPPTATPLPPAPTPTPAPQQPVAPSEPTAVPAPQPTNVPAATTGPEPTVPPLIPTVVAAPTSVPTAVATLVPTRAAVVATFVPAQLSMVPSSLFHPIFAFSGNLPGGQPITRDLVLGNDGAYDFNYHLSATGGAGGLWADGTNGLQATVTVDGTVRYSGSLAGLNNTYMGFIGRGDTQDMNITVSLPVGVPNAYQGQTVSAAFTFHVICATAC